MNRTDWSVQQSWSKFYYPTNDTVQLSWDGPKTDDLKLLQEIFEEDRKEVELNIAHEMDEIEIQLPHTFCGVQSLRPMKCSIYTEQNRNASLHEALRVKGPFIGSFHDFFRIKYLKLNATS